MSRDADEFENQFETGGERGGHPWLFRINSPREIEFSPAAAGGIIFAVIQTE